MQAVNDLHVWALRSTQPVLTAPVMPGDRATDADAVVNPIVGTLHERVDADHATLQTCGWRQF